MKKTLILLRHAHRDITDREVDNGLSEKGLQQVDRLEKELLKEWGLKALRDFLFFSSPKKRCVETILPLSRHSKKGLQIESRLDEQHHGETYKDFINRIHFALAELTHLDGNLLLCSHGDWIPEATGLLMGQPVALRKAEWVSLRSADKGFWTLTKS